MAEINLLPEDLRKKEIEEKKRITKHPKSFEIVLNQPALEKKKTIIKPNKKESWWRRIFGYPTNYPVQYNEPVNEKLKERDINNFNSFNFNINKLQEKNKVVEVKQVKENQQKRSWLSFLGKPKPLIISLPQIKKEIKKSENLKSKTDNYQSQPLTSIKDYNQEKRFVKFIDKDFKNKETVSFSKKSFNFVKKYNDSWWQILMSLFVPVKHQNEKVKLVSDDIELKNKISQPINFQKSSFVAIKNHQVNNQTPIQSTIKNNNKIDKKKKKSTIAYNLIENKENTNIPNINFASVNFNQKLEEKNEWWYLIIAIVVPIIILLLTYGFIFLGQSQLTASLKQRNALLDSKIKEIGDYEFRLKKNNELAEHIKNIDYLRKNKLAWSNFFDLLEKYTLNGVYYNNLNIDTSGSFLLPGIADSYETVAKQLALLNQASDFVKDAKISNIQIFSDNKTGTSGVSFQLRLILADKVFSLKSK